MFLLLCLNLKMEFQIKTHTLLASCQNVAMVTDDGTAFIFVESIARCTTTIGPERTESKFMLFTVTN